MLNVEQITSELARLPDQSLQHYAMLHKDDPYVMSLALSESNRRKQLRTGAHMQAPQQPSVAEQTVAGMAPQQQLPEQMGIGQLPAPNMQRFDDGGIVGYAEGGPNPASGPAGQLAYNNEPVLRMAKGGMVAFVDNPDQPVSSDMPATDSGAVQRILQKSPYDRTPEDNALLEQAGHTLYRKVVPENSGIARVNTYLNELGPRIRDYLTEGASRLSDEELARRPDIKTLNERILRGIGLSPSAPPKAPQSDAVGSVFVPGPGTAPAVRPVSDAPLVKPAPPKVAPGTLAANAAAAAGPAATATQPSGLEALMSKIEGQLGAAEKPQSMAEYTKARREYLGTDPTIAQAERLAALEKRSGSDKDTALGTALMQMGLGMMSAKAVPGGKLTNLLSAAGEGGKAGLASFAESTKELKAAEREREKLRSSIENAQYSLKVGDLDAYEKYRKEVADRTEKRNEHLASAQASLGGIAMQGQTQKEISAGTNITHLQAARISAAGHDPLALYRALGNGDITAGYTLAKQDPIRAQMTEKWSAQAYPVTGMANDAFLKRYPTPEAYIQDALTMQSGAGGAGGGGGNAPVVRSR